MTLNLPGRIIMAIGWNVTWFAWALCSICGLYLMINKIKCRHIDRANRAQKRIQAITNAQAIKGERINKLITEGGLKHEISNRVVVHKRP